jgi:hypothetical protein
MFRHAILNGARAVWRRSSLHGEFVLRPQWVSGVARDNASASDTI